MSICAEPTQTSKSKSVNSDTVKKSSGSRQTFQFADNRPETLAQQELQTLSDESSQVMQLKVFQDMANKSLQPSKTSTSHAGKSGGIAAAMGQQYGVDTSPLKFTHNSSFPSTVNAAATIQGSDIHFAPGQDNTETIKHEVGHYIDNTLNGVPAGNTVVNGRTVDTTRESFADQMAGALLQRTVARDGLGINPEERVSNYSQETTIQRVKAQDDKVEYCGHDAKNLEATEAIKVKTKWDKTHFVKMTNGSLYNNGSMDNQGPIIKRGEELVVDPQSKIFSRRSGNMEKEANQKAAAAKKESDILWYKVLIYNGESVSDKDYYIREETISVGNAGSVGNADSNVEVSDYLDYEETRATHQFGGDRGGNDFWGTFASIGVTGDFGDRHVGLDSDMSSEFFTTDLSGEKAAKLNDYRSDLFEGANVATGILAFHAAMADFKGAGSKYEKSKAVVDAVAALGTITHGGAKFTKGIALTQGKDSTLWTKVGDVGAAAADVTGAIAGILSTIDKFKELKNNWNEDDGFEKFERLLELASTSVGTVQSGMNAAKDIIKIGSEVGSTSFGNLTAAGAGADIVNLTKASAIAGIIIGTINFAQGAIGLYQAANKKKSFRQEANILEEHINTALSKIDQTFEKVRNETLNETDKKLLELLTSKKEELQSLNSEMALLVSAHSQIQSTKMGSSKFKMATGAMGVASGALLLSGVGAPIAVGLGVVSGILSMGNAVLDWRSEKHADRLTVAAQRMNNDGKIVSSENNEPKNFFEMRDRVTNFYYDNLDQVIMKDKGTVKNKGISNSEFTDIKRFVWTEKKKKVPSGNEKTLASIDSLNCGCLSEKDKRDNWIEAKKPAKKRRINSDFYKEKPKGSEWVAFKMSADASKSKKAHVANAELVAETLYRLGAGSYSAKEGKFIPCELKIGNDNGKNLNDAIAKTSVSLLAAAGISEKRWKSWLDAVEKAKKDKKGSADFVEKMMKDKIAAYIA
jgi:hypothetical protein